MADIFALQLEECEKYIRSRDLYLAAQGGNNVANQLYQDGVLRGILMPVHLDKAKFDVKPHILYDRQNIATNQSTQLSFFALPLGQSQNGATKVEFDTNMRVAAMLGAPQRMSIYGIQVQYQASVSVTDLKGVMGDGYFKFSIGEKTYVEAPLQFIPSGGGIFSAIGNISQEVATSCWPSTGEVLWLARGRTKPLMIVDQQPFKATIDWQSAISLGLTVDCWVKLLGVLYWGIQ